MMMVCKIFISQHGYKLINWGDPAAAARDLAAGLLPSFYRCEGKRLP
jgi:hypothetical protein